VGQFLATLNPIEKSKYNAINLLIDSGISRSLMTNTARVSRAKNNKVVGKV